MKLKIFALGVVALLALVAPANAVLLADGSVSGGGFTREGKGKDAVKRMLTIQATDGATDSGQAQYKETRPGTGTPLTVRVAIDCVVTSENHAYASGTASSGNQDWDGATALIHIQDNGDGKKGGDAYGIARASEPQNLIERLLLGNCGAGSVGANAIHGGNFQVAPAG
jgi:hypothetical protein